MTTERTFEGWAVLELLGHRTVAGFVRTVRFVGQDMLMVDVHWRDPGKGIRAIQYYSGSALYCLTPCTEERAREQAGYSEPEEWTEPQLRAGEDTDDEQGDDQELEP